MLTRFQPERDLQTCMKLLGHADYVLLQFTDTLGSLRGRTILPEETEKAMKEGVGFDGSSMQGGVKIEESDLVMKPDPSTFAVCPHYFYDKSVVSLICSLHTPNGERYEGDPRYTSQKATQKAQQAGFAPTAAAEMEFYLVQKNGEGGITSVENHLIDKQRYFDIAPGRDLTETYRMNLSNALISMGITVERSQHEVGAAQNEITFRYSDPVTTSDNIMLYKFAAKAVADRKHGWIATFMPKPWAKKAGNGMHIHIGIQHAKTGKNLFYDKDGYAQLSETCRHFIGGLLEHARALCPILAPTVNSYKRLVPGYEAPIYIAWGRRNRSALIRVPEYSNNIESEVRIEFRCPDPLCNPYLAYTVILEAGLEGIRKKTEPEDAAETNIYHLTETKRKELGIQLLPTSLKEALEEWKTDDICTKALGREIAEKYAQLKLEEWKEYEDHIPQERDEVTPWEIQKYLYS